MSKEDRERWDRKYAGAGANERPPAVVGVPPARPGDIALDVACGRGRNSEALLAAGYTVVAADIALGALRDLAQRFASQRVPPMPVCCDLEEWPFAPRSFDLILQYDFLDRGLIEPIRASVRSGGHVLIDTFRCTTERPPAAGPSNPAYRLEDGELESRFADWEIVDLSATDTPTARARILARKPR